MRGRGLARRCLDSPARLGQAALEHAQPFEDIRLERVDLAELGARVLGSPQGQPRLPAVLTGAAAGGAPRRARRTRSRARLSSSSTSSSSGPGLGVLPRQVAAVRARGRRPRARLSRALSSGLLPPGLEPALHAFAQRLLDLQPGDAAGPEAGAVDARRDLVVPERLEAGQLTEAEGEDVLVDGRSRRPGARLARWPGPRSLSFSMTRSLPLPPRSP